MSASYEWKFKIGQRVQVIEGTDDYRDDWAIGSIGTVCEYDSDGYYNVKLDREYNLGRSDLLDTFGEYQLEAFED